MVDTKKQFNVRIDSELIEWLKVEAKKDHRTVVSQLTYILKKERARVTSAHKD